MSTKSINFRIDDLLKDQADALLSEMGLSMSSALNLFLQQMVNKKALPFIVEAADPFFSKANQELLKSRLANYSMGIVEEKNIIEVD